MSGIAIIIPGADFSGKNLGKVNLLQDTQLNSIAIVADDSYTGRQFTLSVSYTPVNTAYRGVTWEIVSGGEYASIDPETGTVSIGDTAAGAAIRIKASSLFNPEITAEKTVTVNYSDTVAQLDSISIIADSSYTGRQFTPTVAYTPDNTSLKGVTWSIDAGTGYASIDPITGTVSILDGTLEASPVRIKAVSTANPEITARKTIMVTYSDPWEGVVYELPAPTSLDGVKDYVNTGVRLYDRADKEWSIILSASKGGNYVSGGTSFTNPILACMPEQSPWPGIILGIAEHKLKIIIKKSSAVGDVVQEVAQFCMSKSADGKYNALYRRNFTESWKRAFTDMAISVDQFDLPAVLGATWAGTSITDGLMRHQCITIHKCKIYAQCIDVDLLKTEL